MSEKAFASETKRAPGRALVISGGSVDEALALRFFREESLLPSLTVAADRGLEFFAAHGIKPDIIVGDFDSAGSGLPEKYAQDPSVEILRYIPEKDSTDTELALAAAIGRGFAGIDLLGATGTRLDHVCGNIQLLSWAAARGAQVRILDPHNRVCLKQEPFVIRRDLQWGSFISLFAYGGPVTGLTLRGFKYETENLLLTTGETRGVSNEITAEEGHVSFTSGSLLVMETKD